ncbi:MAG: hypothetical protein LIO46_07915 [Clostridiales bacterium]|nr:hypothetical protein [Clostridiales bacterium]
MKKFLGKTLYVQDVILRDINVTYRESEENLRFADFVPENRTQYPEIWRFRDLPAYGLYARHVDGLTLENVQVTPRGANTREKLVFKDAVNTVVDTDSAI